MDALAIEETRHAGRGARGLPGLAREWPALVICMVSLSYYVSGLAAREASLLESQDLGIASKLFDDFALSLDHSPPHFVFLNLWQGLNGSSFAYLRLPSAVFCALCAAVVFDLAKRAAGLSAGLAAAVLFAVNPLVVDNARSTRMYSLVLLLSALCLRYAYLHLCRGKDTKYASGFIGCAIALLYTHLFASLLVGSLVVLLAVDLYRRRDDRLLLRQLSRRAAIAGLLLVPQVVHGIAALEFVRERHARYPGLSTGPAAFLRSVFETLFLGETEPGAAWLQVVTVAAGVLALLGMAAMKRRGLIVAASVFLPSFGISWLLCRSSEVEARYLNYLVPVIAVLQGVGVARTVPGLLRGPVVIALVAGSLAATQFAYDVPPTDWYQGAARVSALGRDKTVVAVFPAYWASTFRRYSGGAQAVPIAHPVDLERVLARGRRVLLVRYTPPDFRDVAATIATRATHTRLFSTSVRTPFEVFLLVPRAPDSQLVSAAIRAAGPGPSLLLTGLVGSGGYAWQQKAHPGRGLLGIASLLRSADLALASYTPYDPPWYMVALRGLDALVALRPNPAVARAIRRAGVAAVAMNCRGSACSQAEDTLLRSHLDIIPRQLPSQLTGPRVYRIGKLNLGVLNLAATRAGRAAGLAESQGLGESIARARSALGGEGRLIAMLEQAPDYARMPTRQEQAAARRLVELGVDVVVGIGGSAAKEIEEYRGGLIAYSLGSLLCPPMRSLCTSDASGLALRITWGADGMRYAAIPLAFDDTSNVHFGTQAPGRLLVSRTDPSERSLTDRLATASASYAADGGGVRAIGAWDEDRSSVATGFEQWLQGRTRGLTEWLPRAPPSTALRPFFGGFCGHGAFAMRRGVLSGGAYRRAVELDSGAQRAARVVFPKVVLGDALIATIGFADDRARTRSRPLLPQSVAIRIGKQDALRESIETVPGWRSFTIDTSGLVAQSRNVEFEVATAGTHFPVAFELAVRNAPDG